ncbi:hypothetical protein VB712_02825, partial [Spirulina sp. CCNP1310]|nr:hypothetical protein [Spirulina sp. CCNP1310]
GRGRHLDGGMGDDFARWLWAEGHRDSLLPTLRARATAGAGSLRRRQRMGNGDHNQSLLS